MHLRRDMPPDVPGDVARDVPADMRDTHETFGIRIACLHASVYAHVRRTVLCFFIFYFMYGHETTHR